MKIVCNTFNKADTLIREMEVGGILAGYRITEIRLNKKDIARLVERLINGSVTQRETTAVWLLNLQSKFPPMEDK